jgi:hypothetical protein
VAPTTEGLGGVIAGAREGIGDFFLESDGWVWVVRKVMRLGAIGISHCGVGGWIHVPRSDCDLWGARSRPYNLGKILRPPGPNITGQRE